MTRAELILARCSLGLPNARRTGYAQPFYASCGDEYETIWRALALRGHADFLTSVNGVFVYRLTRAGALAAMKPSETLDARSFAPAPAAAPTDAAA